MTDFNEYAAEQEEQTGIAINVEVYNAAGSQSTQNSQVEEMLDAGCNVICVNLVDRTEPNNDHRYGGKKIMCRSFSSTGNWWRRIWSAGTGSIMSGRKHSSPESCRGRLRRMRSRRIRMPIRTVTVSSSMWCWREKPGHQDAIVRTEYAVSTIIDNGVEVEKLAYGDCELEPGAGADQDDADACGI